MRGLMLLTLTCMLPVLDPVAAWAQVTAEQAIATSDRLVSSGQCGKSGAGDGEIVVCGSARSKYRLPLPLGPPKPGARLAGDIPRASVDVASSRECGVHRGQRNCGLRELRAYGYGGGSTPLRAAAMLVRKLVDPGAETGSPGGRPITRQERE